MNEWMSVIPHVYSVLFTYITFPHQCTAECCTWWVSESPTTTSWLTANSTESEHWSMESVSVQMTTTFQGIFTIHHHHQQRASHDAMCCLSEWALPGIRWININIGYVIVIGKLPCSWHYESEWINGIKPLLILELNTVEEGEGAS